MNRPLPPLRLGTRGSPLALAQARQVAAALADLGTASEIVVTTTTGDRVQERPLAEIGGKGLWTKELDRALIDGELDACVHSMKDVESERPAQLKIVAIRPRADVRDRLIGASSIEALRQGAVVGTSSPRRAAQLLRLRPDLQIVPIRGNVETRLRKVAAGEFDATLLAAAGLERLGIDDGAPIGTELLLPAPGQAAIGIECRADDPASAELLAAISDPAAFACVMAERAFTRALGATCASPVAALALRGSGGIRLRAQLFSSDGSEMIEDQADFTAGDDLAPEALARSMLARAPAAIATLFENA